MLAPFFWWTVGRKCCSSHGEEQESERPNKRSHSFVVDLRRTRQERNALWRRSIREMSLLLLSITAWTVVFSASTVLRTRVQVQSHLDSFNCLPTRFTTKKRFKTFHSNIACACTQTHVQREGWKRQARKFNLGWLNRMWVDSQPPSLSLSPLCG